MEMSRDWEAFWRFRELVDRYPNHTSGESILYSAFSLSVKLEDVEESKDTGAVKVFTTKKLDNSEKQRLQGLGLQSFLP